MGTCKNVIFFLAGSPREILLSNLKTVNQKPIRIYKLKDDYSLYTFIQPYRVDSKVSQSPYTGHSTPIELHTAADMIRTTS